MNFKAKPNTLGNENKNLTYSQQIDHQQQFQNKIEELNNRKKKIVEQNEKLEQSIKEYKDKIKKQQEYNNPVVKQLRQHFKALKEEIKMNMSQEQDEGDDIDIDNMTYEELLQLGQHIGKVSKGLAKSKFDALERFTYEKDFNLQCTICQEQFDEEHECIRLDCKHFFHNECLKGWLQVQKICPNCKEEIK